MRAVITLAPKAASMLKGFLEKELESGFYTVDKNAFENASELKEFEFFKKNLISTNWNNTSDSITHHLAGAYKAQAVTDLGNVNKPCWWYDALDQKQVKMVDKKDVLLYVSSKGNWLGFHPQSRAVIFGGHRHALVRILAAAGINNLLNFNFETYYYDAEGTKAPWIKPWQVVNKDNQEPIRNTMQLEEVDSLGLPKTARQNYLEMSVTGRDIVLAAIKSLTDKKMVFEVLEKMSKATGVRATRMDQLLRRTVTENNLIVLKALNGIHQPASELEKIGGRGLLYRKPQPVHTQSSKGPKEWKPDSVKLNEPVKGSYVDSSEPKTPTKEEWDEAIEAIKSAKPSVKPLDPDFTNLWTCSNFEANTVVSGKAGVVKDRPIFSNRLAGIAVSGEGKVEPLLPGDRPDFTRMPRGPRSLGSPEGTHPPLKMEYKSGPLDDSHYMEMRRILNGPNPGALEESGVSNGEADLASLISVAKQRMEKHAKEILFQSLVLVAGSEEAAIAILKKQEEAVSMIIGEIQGFYPKEVLESFFHSDTSDIGLNAKALNDLKALKQFMFENDMNHFTGPLGQLAEVLFSTNDDLMIYPSVNSIT